VKATIFFRGREMTHTNLGRQVLERLLKEIGERAVVEFRPRMEGNTLHAILAPPKKAEGKKQQPPPKPQQSNPPAAQQA
jgi:translation initiation factor IF-3